MQGILDGSGVGIGRSGVRIPELPGVCTDRLPVSRTCRSREAHLARRGDAAIGVIGERDRRQGIDGDLLLQCITDARRAGTGRMPHPVHTRRWVNILEGRSCRGHGVLAVAKTPVPTVHRDAGTGSILELKSRTGTDGIRHRDETRRGLIPDGDGFYRIGSTTIPRDNGQLDIVCPRSI